MTIEIKENQIIFTELLRFQPKHIFQAYTDATLFKQWFHPEGTTLEIYANSMFVTEGQHFCYSCTPRPAIR